VSSRPPPRPASGSHGATEDLLSLKRGLEEQVQALRSRVATLEDTNARLEAELGTVKREAQVSVEALRAQLGASEETVPRLTRQMRTMQEELHELRARVDVLRAVSLPVHDVPPAALALSAVPPARQPAEPLSPRRVLPPTPSMELGRPLSPTRSLSPSRLESSSRPLPRPGVSPAPDARDVRPTLESYASTPAHLRRPPPLSSMPVPAPPSRPPLSTLLSAPPSRTPASHGVDVDALGPPRRRPPMVPGTGRY
jgi:hypothetical protein